MKKWKRIGLAGILTVSLAGLPQFATAGERYDYSGGYRPRYGYDDPRGNYVYRYDRHDRYYRDERSAGQSAAIIGGSAAAGAAFGAIAGGGKGAAIGAAIGGIGGLIIDQSTRNNDRNNDRYRR